MDHVLYFCASKAAARDAEAALQRVARRASPARAAKVRLAVETSPVRALMKVRSGGVDLLVVDARDEGSDVAGSASLSVLRALYGEHDLARVLGRERALLVVGGDAHDAAIAFEAGRLHLGGVVAFGGEGWEGVWERIAATLARARGGKVALCLAGGGTEGLLFELGVLRALDKFLVGTSIADVDLICGISAGAILGGFLANGLRPEEIAAGLERGEGKIRPLQRWQLFDPNVGELARRAARLSWDVA
ncbi:MAG TPA: patatin-like phospholipase family protein, partial [Minicystis sp.]|nr:patatin-like phospholipase family protein [Minicystis sp.]